jgi:hypothetical protein
VRNPGSLQQENQDSNQRDALLENADNVEKYARQFYRILQKSGG